MGGFAFSVLRCYHHVSLGMTAHRRNDRARAQAPEANTSLKPAALCLGEGVGCLGDDGVPVRLRRLAHAVEKGELDLRVVELLGSSAGARCGSLGAGADHL